MHDRLRVIGILFLVLGGLSLLMILFIPFHYALMRNITDMETTFEQGAPDFDRLMTIMQTMYWVMGIVAAIFGSINISTGICLLKRIYRNWCVVGSAIACLSIPLGTALGIWSLMTITSEEGKAEFQS